MTWLNRRSFKALTAVAIVMLVLDLVWLGIAAQPIYDAQLGSLRARETVVVAAALFYAQYVVVVTFFAVLPASTIKQAAWRGAGVGWVAYATYELTNMALIANWAAWIIPIDVVWGMVLTTTVATVGWSVVGPPPPTREPEN